MNAQKLVEGFVETAEVGVHERADASACCPLRAHRTNIYGLQSLMGGRKMCFVFFAYREVKPNSCGLWRRPQSRSCAPACSRTT